MYRTILVPLDGSTFAEDALPMGRLLAETLGAELHLAHVIRPAPDVILKTPQEDFDWKEKVWDLAADYLEAHAEEARADGASTLTAVLEGRVVDALEDYADEQEIDLIVLTTHGEGGVRRWWLGSVADRLMKSPTRDLLLVRPWDDTEERPEGRSRFDRILVPVDGSEHAEAALGRAREMAAAFSARVDGLMVLPKPLNLSSIRGVPGVEMEGPASEERLEEARRYLRDLAGRVGPDGIEMHVIEAGGAAEGVIEAAKTEDADLIVLSSHGRSGLERAVLGSVADKVIRGTTRPVLVVRAVAENEGDSAG